MNVHCKHISVRDPKVLGVAWMVMRSLVVILSRKFAINLFANKFFSGKQLYNTCIEVFKGLAKYRFDTLDFNTELSRIIEHLRRFLEQKKH